MEKESMPEAVSASTNASASDNGVAVVDAAAEKAVLRKIDRVVLPLMCLVYFFQYLDKQAVGYAAVFNLADDLHMNSNEYSWVVSIFYLGQLTAEYLFIYLMSRLSISRLVGYMIIIWGVVAGCLAAPHNFSGFAAVRFILGACEGAVSPAFVMITAQWYKKSEHPIRIAAWVSCNGAASIIGALIMYGVGLAENVAIANWRVMFLICGGATALCGVLFLLLMPQGPETAWFLTEAEREIACQRLRDDGSSTKEDKPKFQRWQLMEALRDPFCWAAVLIGFLGTFASPVLKYASLVISGFGWSKFNTMLVALPSGFLQILFIWIAVIGIRVTKIPRCYWGVALTVLPLVGNIGIYLIPSTNKWGVVVFTWLATVISPVMVVSLSLMASNIKGTTKKSAVSNGYFIAYGAAAVAAPQLWQTTDAPRYVHGLTADIICLSCIILVFIGYRLCVLRENKRRDAAESTQGLESNLPNATPEKTDREDVTLRYIG